MAEKFSVEGKICLGDTLKKDFLWASSQIRFISWQTHSISISRLGSASETLLWILSAGWEKQVKCSSPSGRRHWMSEPSSFCRHYVILEWRGLLSLFAFYPSFKSVILFFRCTTHTGLSTCVHLCTHKSTKAPVLCVAEQIHLFPRQRGKDNTFITTGHTGLHTANQTSHPRPKYFKLRLNLEEKHIFPLLII